MDTLLTSGAKQKPQSKTLLGNDELIPIPESYEGTEWDLARKSGYLMDKDGNVIDPQKGVPLSWNGDSWN